MGSMFKPSVFDHYQLGLINDWVGDRGRPDSKSSLRNQDARLQVQSQDDEILTIDQGTITSALELSSPIPITEQV